MTLWLRIAARAAREIERVDAWWRENREAVPGAVREELQAAFQLLLQQPGVGVKVAGARMPATRRLHLRRIGCFLCYRVPGQELTCCRYGIHAEAVALKCSR